MASPEGDSSRVDPSNAAAGAGPETSGGIHNEGANSKRKLKLEGMGVVIFSVVVVSFGVTIALLISIFMGQEQVVLHGAVAVDDTYCGELGVQLMKNGKGNAVDSAVATALCLSVTRPDAVSLAGCGVMLVHDRNKQKSSLFDFMCSAPSVTAKGSLVGVPGFVRGLYAAHSQFGELPWKKLFDGAIKAASSGFMPSQGLVSAAQTVHRSSANANPIATTIAKAGSRKSYMPSSHLQSSLQSLARYGPAYFYEGEFRIAFMNYMKSKGHLWKDSDLSGYRVLEPTPIQMGFAGFTLDSFPAPVAGGPFLLSLLGNVDMKNHLYPLNYDASTRNNSAVTALLLHRLIEFAKHAEANASSLGDLNDASIASDVLAAQEEMLRPSSRNKLMTLVNDTTVLPYPGSTFFESSHDIGDIEVGVTDPVRLTVVFNLFLGSPFGNGEMIPQTGVHLNSALKLFTPVLPSAPKTLNAIGPGRRPLLPVAPVYMATSVRKCGIRVGVASSNQLDAAQAIVNAALFLRGLKCELPETAAPAAALESDNPLSPAAKPGDYTPAVQRGCIDAKKAISLSRFLLQFSTTTKDVPVLTEANFETDLINQLKTIGHDVRSEPGAWSDHVAMVGWNGYELLAFADQRSTTRLHTY